jgi:hypothetical protein
MDEVENDEDEFFLISSSSHSVNAKTSDEPIDNDERNDNTVEQDTYYFLNSADMSQHQQQQLVQHNRLSNIIEEDDIDEEDELTGIECHYSNNMLLDELIERLNIEQKCKFDTKNYLLDDENMQLYESLREFNDDITSQHEQEISDNEDNENDFIEKGFDAFLIHLLAFATKNTHGFGFGLSRAGPAQKIHKDERIQPKLKTVGIFACKCLYI